MIQATSARADPLEAAESGQRGASLRMEKHPDKTFIGRIERGFDFLGYHFGPEGLTSAARTSMSSMKRT